MKGLFIFLFLLTTIGCFGQINSLTVDFSPSFIEESQLMINKENSKYSMSIHNSKINEKCLLADSLTSDLQLFFVDYFKQKFTLDSIEKVNELEREKNGIHVVGLDGITVKGVLVDKNGERSFDFWSPQKQTINHKLMSILFKQMYSTFNKPETINYLENLEGYFAFGLGLKKLSESPLTYKMYGSISSNKEKELSDFFSELPTDKEIYFDMSNFRGMGTMFYESFKTLCQRNKNIYWINCSGAAKKQLSEAGIPMTSIK